MRALNGLVVMEIALAVVLLTFAGLLTKSFAYLLHTNLGYRTDRLLTFRMPLPASRYKNDEAILRFCDRLLPQLAALPGVVSAAASESVPLGGTYSGTPVEIEGQTSHRDWAEVMTRSADVTPDYFRTMGIPLRAGRAFDASDTAGAEPVAIVNQAFVRKLMPGQSPLGARVRLDKEWQRIVGVVGDTRYNGPADTVEAEAYTPFAQNIWLEFVALRTAIPEEAVMSAARHVIRKMDPGLAITEVRRMRESVDSATEMQRAMMALVAAFAALTLGMATLGLGGVMAYAVSRRKREIGLRMALGARRADVVRAILGNAGRLILVGSAIGMLCAFAAARALESLLYGVRPHDPAIIVAAPVVLGAIALLACLAPVRRAASIEPMAALRQE